MNLKYHYNKVGKCEKDIADLQKKIAAESKKEHDKQKKINTISKSINKNTPQSSYKSKMRQIEGLQQEINRIQKNKADLHKKLANKTQELNKNKTSLFQAEMKENEKRQREQEKFQRKIKQDLENHNRNIKEIINPMDSKKTITVETNLKKFDFFISHASEDKDEIVRPLAEKLKENSLNVWYDEAELKVGDSLRRKIDEGLKTSRFGIVILSENFFKKDWPQYELDGLVAREIKGIKVILPIWHNVTKDEVLSFSPPLADKVALNTSIYRLNEIVNELRKLVD